MSLAEVRSRWLAFLGKIEARHDSVIREAKTGCLQLLDLAALDTNPMANAWQGVRSQLLTLRSKIEDTWSERVEDAFRVAYETDRIDGDPLDELKVGEEAIARLDRESVRAEIEIFSQAAGRLMEAAREELSVDFRCTQCAATLEIDRGVFRSHYVTCGFCGVTNTYNPGTRVRRVEDFCALHLAKRATLELEFAKVDAWEKVRRARVAAYEQLLELERVTNRYWTEFYRVRAEIVPAFENDREADLGARMREFYDAMKHQENWRPR